jgi:hypothetical protein
VNISGVSAATSYAMTVRGGKNSKIQDTEKSAPPGCLSVT